MSAGVNTRGARALMVQGTCSGAGKSLLVAGLARIFSDMGVKVAPFKSQNMALNSFITGAGGEIGRAQALQAEAARIEPVNDINPILLKATGEKGCQVIVNGAVHSNMTARQYYSFRDEAWKAVTEAYERLKSDYELILIEGAGSPAEINLMEEEVVNMRVAKYANSPVFLAGDIDRGGVFASFAGTMSLLGGDADYIKGFIVNKFRGDLGILQPGLSMIKDRTGVPVVGVVPYIKDVGLDEEDGFSSLHFRPLAAGDTLRVVVVRLEYISNFTDFEPFRYEPDVELLYSTNPVDIENADLLIVPGSKNTVRDLVRLKEMGLDGSIRRAAKKGVPVAGVCGGYQMLGKKISDPLGLESDYGDIECIGLLDVETEIKGRKVTSRCEAETELFGYKGKLAGYEIHMGQTSGDVGAFTLSRLADGSQVRDGSIKDNAWGTYLHGLFDSDGFREALLNSLRKRKGIAPRPSVRYLDIRDRNMSRWADVLRKSLDMDFIRGLL